MLNPFIGQVFFLSRNTFEKCSSLYNFCRTLDDIVDDNNNLDVKKEIFSKFKKDFENKNLNNRIIKDMWSVIDSENISKQIVIDLFDGVKTDLEEKVVINSKKDLLVYSL
jgi:phytoene synthase